MESHPTDTLLLEKVKNSDLESFRILYHRFQPIVFRRVYFQTHQIDLSHDIVQETFVRIWEHRTKLNPQLGILAYALRISLNLVRDSAKHADIRARSEHLVPAPNLSENDNPEAALSLGMLQERISQIVRDHLPDRCRTVFLLSRFECMPNRDIAEHLGLSVRTVEHQIQKAMKILRKRLKGFIAG